MSFRCARLDPSSEEAKWSPLMVISPERRMEVISHLGAKGSLPEQGALLSTAFEYCFGLCEADPTRSDPFDVALLICSRGIEIFSQGQTELDHEQILKLLHHWHVRKGIVYCSRYHNMHANSDDITDLDQAISSLENAERLFPISIDGANAEIFAEEQTGTVLYYLHAAVLLSRYRHMHQPGDSNKALHQTDMFLFYAPKNHPFLDDFFELKSAILFLRFEYTQDDTDRARAAVAFAKILGRKGDLGLYDHYCSRRALISPNLKYNFETMSAYHQQALAAAKDDDLRPILPGRPPEVVEFAEHKLELHLYPEVPFYSSIGPAADLQSQFRGGNNVDLADLDRAIEISRILLKLTTKPIGIMFDELSGALLLRYHHTGQESDLFEAISIQEDLVSATPENEPDKCRFRSILGDIYLAAWAGGFLDPAQAVIKIMSQWALAANPTLQASDQLSCQAAVRLASFLDSLPNTQCLEAYGWAMESLSEYVGIRNIIQERQDRLGEFTYLTSLASGSAISEGQNEKALEWLEQGRCLVWNQINDLRTPMDNLIKYSPSLGQRAARVASLLDYGGAYRWKTDIIDTPYENGIGASQQFKNAQEWENILSEIRGIPGFLDFLRPPRCRTILDYLPQGGIVIIINVNERKAGRYGNCDALALLPSADSPLHIPLPKFSRKKAKRLLHNLSIHRSNHRAGSSNLPPKFRSISLAQRLQGITACEEDIHRGSHFETQLGITDILSALWVDVVEPILDGLAILGSSSVQPRIWWCPTAELAFLPIHAAGIYGTRSQASGPCISDFAVSSYIPSVSTLIECARRSGTSAANSRRLLAVSQPNTPGLAPIPSTITELVHIQNQLKIQNVHCTGLEGKVAVLDRVREEIKSHSWIHLACHASQNAEDPMESGFYLEDGILKLSDIIKENLPNADLAFLSACETSTGDHNLSDEAVHLAGGMLAAGYRRVIGTTWTIRDHYGPRVAKYFYESLLEGTGGVLDGAGAAHALHVSIKTLRGELGDSDKDFMTWLPYVHFGY